MPLRRDRAAVAGGIAASLCGFCLLVELGGLLEVFDLEREMNDAIHLISANGES
jgi:hypothetical protein